MVSHKLTLMHHTSLLAIVVAAGKTTTIISHALRLRLFADSRDLHSTSSHSSSSSDRSKHRPHDWHSSSRRISTNSSHRSLRHSLSDLHRSSTISILTFDLSQLLLLLPLNLLLSLRVALSSLNLSIISSTHTSLLSLTLRLRISRQRREHRPNRAISSSRESRQISQSLLVQQAQRSIILLSMLLIALAQLLQMRIHLTILLHLQRSLSQRRHTKVRTAPIRSILLLTMVATTHRLTLSIQTFSGRLRQRISLPLHLIPTQLSILSTQTLQQTLILLLTQILLPVELIESSKLHFLLLLGRLLRILISQLTHLSPIRLLARQLLAVVLLSIGSLRFIYLLSRAPLLSIFRTLLQSLQHDLIARIFILALTHHPTLMLQLQRLQVRLFRAVHLRLRPLQTAFFLLLVILFQLLLPLITRSQIQLIPVTLPLQMLSVHRHQTSIILRIRQRTSSILRAQIFHTLLALLVQLLLQRSTLLSFALQEWVSSLSTTSAVS